MTQSLAFRNTDLRDAIAGYLAAEVIRELTAAYAPDYVPLPAVDLAGHSPDSLRALLRMACDVLSSSNLQSPELRYVAHEYREETFREIRRRLPSLVGPKNSGTEDVNQ